MLPSSKSTMNEALLSNRTCIMIHTFGDHRCVASSSDLVAAAHFLQLFAALLFPPGSPGHATLSALAAGGSVAALLEAPSLEAAYEDADSPLVFAAHAALLARVLPPPAAVLLYTWEDQLLDYLEKKEAARVAATAAATAAAAGGDADGSESDASDRDGGESVFAAVGIDPATFNYRALPPAARVRVTLALVSVVLDYDASFRAYLDTLAPHSLVRLPCLLPVVPGA
jgi:hypothetical protein